MHGKYTDIKSGFFLKLGSVLTILPLDQVRDERFGNMLKQLHLRYWNPKDFFEAILCLEYKQIKCIRNQCRKKNICFLKMQMPF